MRVVIINQNSPKRVNYIQALNGMEAEVLLITKNKYVEEFKEIFENTIGFDNFENNDLIYPYIVDLHKEKEIDRIIATHEFDLINAGYLREYIGITGQNSESAISFRDKYEMKKKLKHVIKCPDFKRIRNVFDLMKFKEEFGYPFVLKPVDGAASVGVQAIKDDKTYEDILKSGINNNLIAEAFVDGDMYHVDGLYENGKLLFSQPSVYINGCLAFLNEKYLASIMVEKEDPMFDKLNLAVNSVLSNLPTPEHAIAFHAEFFYTPANEIVFCEVASRVGGGMISETIKLAKGIDILKESIRAQCGHPLHIVPKNDELAGFIIIPPKKGRLVSINNNLPFDWVMDCYIKEESIGKEFNGSSSSIDSIASIVVKGNNPKEIHEHFETLLSWFEENSRWDCY